MIHRSSQALQHMFQLCRGAATDLQDLFFPNLCSCCQTNLQNNEEHLCMQCVFKLPKTYYWDYEINPIEELFLGRLKIDGACAFIHMSKGGNTQQMIHSLKYDGSREIGVKLGELFAYQLIEKNRYTDVEMIIPVPLHHTKLRRRGYNQSLDISKGIASVFRCPVNSKNLIRNLATETQTRKRRYDRSMNVESIFGCVNMDEFEGRTVMLVDDVVTTGSTLASSGQVLLDAGVGKLYIVAIAAPN